MPVRPNVLTIPASRPALRTLAGAMLAGEVVAGWPDPGDPLSLSRATVLLPNRRACRALRDVLRDLAADTPLLLPRIAPIGDIDEEEWAFADPQPLDALGLDALAPPLGALDRRLALARLIAAWARGVDKAALRLGPDDALIVSTAPADALALAADLMRLMDQVETERIPWSRLDQIVDGGLDEFWRMTRSFLSIATEHWPAFLADNGFEEPAVRRDRLIAAETLRLAALPGPIIAAGSTGSIPATRDLLRMVALHPRGALVLPGLDTDLDAPSWQAIGMGGAPAFGHPQFGLKRLIDHVGVAREEVRLLATPAPHGREALLAEVMRPAATTERWAGRPSAAAPALEGLAVIEAANEREEALAIAVVLREIAEDPARTAALVTPDRGLARRVLAELGRWQVAADDSGGRPLAGTPAAVVARLLARLCLADPAPADLLALLAHPALLAEEDGERPRAVAAIELGALRGLRPPGGLAGYAARLAEMRPSGHPRPSDPASRLSAEALATGGALLARLIEGLAPLLALAGRPEAALAELAAAHAAALEATGLDAEAEGAPEIAALLAQAASRHGAALPMAPGDYPAVFEALLTPETVRPPGDPGARIRILGLPEARLIAVDTVVLGGLVEGTWPGEARLDPWLNRAMRQSLGIEPPERRMGLAAHDFCQLLGARRAVLTRAAKAGGVPTVPSRWLQRLATVIGPAAWAGLVARGAPVLAWARGLDHPRRVRTAPRPSPAPPRALRPAHLSVTEIETFLRDPYAIYARHVLKLARLRDLDERPGGAERGTIIHGVLDAYAREVAAAGPSADPADRLVALGRAHFAPHWHDPGVQAVWWPRFLRIARWFAGADAERRARFAASHAETRGELAWETAAGRRFVLTARADRIDIGADGQAEIVDYKTGQTPGDKEVASGLAPQLPLEAAILAEGGFAGLPPVAGIAALVYAKLGGRDPAGAFQSLALAGRPPGDLAAESLARLKALVDAFEDEGQGYVSWAIPKFAAERSNDYAHLARVREWTSAGEAE